MFAFAAFFSDWVRISAFVSTGMTSSFSESFFIVIKSSLLIEDLTAERKYTHACILLSCIDALKVGETSCSKNCSY